jgi:hypothetical protein
MVTSIFEITRFVTSVIFWMLAWVFIITFTLGKFALKVVYTAFKTACIAALIFTWFMVENREAKNKIGFVIDLMLGFNPVEEQAKSRRSELAKKVQHQHNRVLPQNRKVKASNGNGNGSVNFRKPAPIKLVAVQQGASQQKGRK